MRRLGGEVDVVRSDAVDLHAVAHSPPDAIVISPGPSHPENAGCSIEAVRRLGRRIPLLGVCLGHQAIAAAYGGLVERADEPRHGRTSLVVHEGQGIFADVPTPFQACRYHSLVVRPDSLPAELIATAFSDDGVLMGLQHVEHPVFGLQFHPESILTRHGYRLLANFLRKAGLDPPHDPEELETAERIAEPAVPPPISRVVTF
ncbi:MAG: aminodeoxychorismate/anthranilate synthase component II, partial [Planctomycetales bacterium]|nr:aminodeoxychorismate/anthranilate synthase component II [Planctomycetales bacterium]